MSDLGTLHQRVNASPYASGRAPHPDDDPSADHSSTERWGGGIDDGLVFVPATKEQAKARVALVGPSGSGKTYTALQLATGLVAGDPTTAHLGGRGIGVIDTERNSASKYAHLFQFSRTRVPLQDFDPNRLIRALAAAAAQDIPVIVIDSFSHFWAGHGGVLELVDQAARHNYGGNKFGGWNEVTPRERQMIDALLSYPGHIIVTMRAKTKYVMAEVNGKQTPRKVGTTAVQREGIDYEFDVVGEMDASNTLSITKTRCPELNGRVIAQPGMELAYNLLKWLNDGVPRPTINDLRAAAAQPEATKADLRELYSQAMNLGLGNAVTFGDDRRTLLTLTEYISRRGQQAPDHLAAPPVANPADQSTGPGAGALPPAPAEPPPSTSPTDPASGPTSDHSAGPAAEWPMAQPPGAPWDNAPPASNEPDHSPQF
ncbi:ATP-binding protein [Actinomadura kijaniata]|uniref:ATP-binding protein n=1 Tax=Actinomadura kijaniata TaxID=46161 RepID=UPI00082D73D3|nr:ATP-binding protein [Actinomadura kijaniata]